MVLATFAKKMSVFLGKRERGDRRSRTIRLLFVANVAQTNVLATFFAGVDTSHPGHTFNALKYTRESLQDKPVWGIIK